MGLGEKMGRRTSGWFDGFCWVKIKDVLSPVFDWPVLIRRGYSARNLVAANQVESRYFLSLLEKYRSMNRTYIGYIEGKLYINCHKILYNRR